MCRRMEGSLDEHSVCLSLHINLGSTLYIQYTVYSTVHVYSIQDIPIYIGNSCMFKLRRAEELIADQIVQRIKEKNKYKQKLYLFRDKN